MQGEYRIFDSTRISLQKGIHLVEASAGTGKTYAIGMLVLRCIAELNIPIDKILIVTFTKGATEELRTRIRARLAEARDLLLGDLSQPDQTLAAWKKRVDNKDKTVVRIQLALLDIDRAAIFTIHSFCQRMLQEQALESGQLFELDLVADINHVRQQIAEDFWRSKVYNLAPLSCGILMREFSSPDNLLESIDGIKGSITHLEPKSPRLDTTISALEEKHEVLSSWWGKNSESLFAHFIENKAFFNKSLRENLETWWRRINDFFSHRSYSIPDGMEYLSHEGLFDVLNGQKLRGETKKRAFLEEWFLPCEEVEAFLEAAQQMVLAFRFSLAQTLSKEVEKVLQQQGIMSFNDLVIRLARALKAKGGDDLRRILARRFSVALLDEFQDTDSEQWYIFSNLFGNGQHYLYLIGDPKQAIYRFRGADIHSYFKARDSAHFYLTLEKNYRTHPHLVEEVNRLFLSRSMPFAFRHLNYFPVVPAKTIEDGWLKREEKPLANMIYCQLPEDLKDKGGRWSSGRASEAFLRFTVAEVSRILDKRQQITLQGKDVTRPIYSRDIAILVRTNKQAQECLHLFAEIGIPAVMVSKRSVFHTDEARDLNVLLRALASQVDTRLLKSAMTLSWFGLTGNDLVEIWQDDELFNNWYNRFLLFFQLWQDQGFLTMMNRLLKETEVYLHLAAGDFAERRISNLHHLLELLQEAERSENYGPTQTLQWLHSMILEKRGAENTELRLESDEDAVKIMTMHGAKGLEYPIVFCPFLWYRSSRLKREKYLISCHDGEKVTDLGSIHFEKRRKLAMDEELTEDLRLLYVALTRAGQQCYVMWADTKPHGMVDSSFSSALGYLLFPEGKVTYHEQKQNLAGRSQRMPVDHLILLEEAFQIGKSWKVHSREEHLRCRHPSPRSLKTDWQMSSYSAMASSTDLINVSVMKSETHETDTDPAIPITNLPAGAHFGNLLHDCLEEVSFASLASGGKYNDILKEKCRRYGISAEFDKLEQMLANIVTTPLLKKKELEKEGKGNFRLVDLPEESCLKEMPFYYTLESMTTKEMNEILVSEPAFTRVSEREMQGYLTGFVDLIVEYKGKFYIIDYKSNNLGNSASNYSPENLVRAMAEHNYGLQFWIYTLVLHRHLENVVPGYNYESNFGGVMYLFVRGMTPSLGGSGVYFTRPDHALLMKLADCLGESGEGRDV